MKDHSPSYLRWIGRLIFGLMLLFFLIFGFWYVAFPKELINKKIDDFFSSKGIALEIEGVRKGLFYSLFIDRVECYIAKDMVRSEQPALTLSQIEVRLTLSSFLRLRPAVEIRGSLEGGTIEGNFSILENHLNLKINDAELEGMRFLNVVGISGKGVIHGSLSIFLGSKGSGEGELRFSVSDARLKDITDKGYIPLSLFNSIRGIIGLDKGRIKIHSLSLEGKGIYGRLQGSTLELMVNSDFSMPSLIEVGLLKFRRSPGYYIIPLVGIERGKVY